MRAVKSAINCFESKKAQFSCNAVKKHYTLSLSARAKKLNA